LAEGWLPAMRDAWERHLDPNAVVVPQRARIVCQVIQGECLSNYWGPHQDVSGFPESRRLKLYERSLQSDTFLLGGTQGTQNGVQIPVHAEQLFTDKRYQVTPLSDPISILDFSVTSKDSIPPPEGRSRTIEFIPTRSGTAHAILFGGSLICMERRLPIRPDMTKDLGKTIGINVFLSFLDQKPNVLN